MRTLVILAVVAMASAKPAPGGLWGAPAVSSLGVVSQPVLHAPVVDAPAATSYASFQQVVHPVSVAQPVVHAAPVVSAVHAPVLPAVSAVHAPAWPAAAVHAPVWPSLSHGW